jgi:hypothetical protein
MDQIISIYEHVPVSQRDLFVGNEIQILQISGHLRGLTDDHLRIASPVELYPLMNSLNFNDVMHRMAYIIRIYQIGWRGYGINYPPTIFVPPNDPPVHWAQECPLVVKKLHYEQAYEFTYEGLGRFSRSLHLIRQRVEDVPQGVDICQGDGFFTGTNGFLSDIRSLANIHTNPLTTPQCEELITSIHNKCAGFEEYTNWIQTLDPGQFVGVDPSHVQLFVQFGSALSVIEKGTKVLSLLGLG